MNMSTTMKTARAAETRAASAATKGLEQTIAGSADGMTRAFEGVGLTQAKLQETAGQAMRKAEEMVRFGQGNIEAMTKSTQIWAAGVQDLSQQVAASFQTGFQEAMGAFKALATVKSLKQAIDLQSGFGRSALERAVSEQERLTAASIKLAESALAPITERARLAGDTFAKTV